MKTPLVAVITRTKDRPNFLKRAIESVHNQTEGNFIHVIYNDGGRPEIVESLVNGYDEGVKSKIHLIHGEGSNGMEDSLFNKAIRAVDSKYVAIHDDDDTWHPEFLERTTKLLEDSDGNGVVVRTDKIIEEIKGNRIEELKSEQFMPDMKAVSLYRQCTENQMTAITFLYRRKTYETVGGYDDELAVCGDWDFGIRFLLQSDVAYLDPGFALAFYHHRKYKKDAEGNTSGSSGDRFAYYTNLLANKYLRDELKSGKLGVGYIMSQHRFNESYLSRLIHRMLPRSFAARLKRRAQR